VGQRKFVSSEPLDIASSYTFLEMRRVFTKQRIAYFRFFVRKKSMPIRWRARARARVCVVPDFLVLEPLYYFHPVLCGRYSISANTIIFLFNLLHSIIITTWRLQQFSGCERYLRPSFYSHEKL
jgi:hypothetical protein